MIWKPIHAACQSVTPCNFSIYFLDADKVIVYMWWSIKLQNAVCIWCVVVQFWQKNKIKPKAFKLALFTKIMVCFFAIVKSRPCRFYMSKIIIVMPYSGGLISASSVGQKVMNLMKVIPTAFMPSTSVTWMIHHTLVTELHCKEFRCVYAN